MDKKMRIDDKIINEVIAALKSSWITTGPRTKEFEQQLAEYCSVEKVMAVNSWTSGAEMLLHWFGIQEGDEVIVFGEDFAINLLAAKIDTIPYEILTSISQRVKRIYYYE
jgi:dTDP-4-amino-4,6-dideoxygalactose transaminase